MNLRTIQLDSKSDKNIRDKCFFITRLYEEYLKKFYLDNSGLLAIELSTDSVSKYEHDEDEKISIYRLSKDISEEILLADDNSVSVVLNRVIYNVINEIIDLAQVGDDRLLSKEKLLNAFDLIQNNNYEYCENIKKLSRLSNCKKYKPIIQMNISPEKGELWTIEIIDRHNNTVIRSDVINKYGSYIARRHMYHHSSWIDNTFLIYNRLDNIVYQIQI